MKGTEKEKEAFGWFIVGLAFLGFSILIIIGECNKPSKEPLTKKTYSQTKIIKPLN